MAIGYRSNGVDFDDIFEPLTGTKRANVGYKVNGTDISNFYEPASSGTPAGNVGYRTGGQDIGPLFAAKGGVTYWDGTLEDIPLIITDFRGEVAPGYALAEILLFDDGTVRQRTATTETTIGRWDGTIADSSNTEVLFEVLSSTIPVSGDTGSWVQVNREVAASIQSSSAVNQTADIRVRLREIGNPSTEITADVELRVQYGNLGGP